MTRFITEKTLIMRHIRNITKRDITSVMSIIIAVSISGQEKRAGILVQSEALTYDSV